MANIMPTNVSGNIYLFSLDTSQADDYIAFERPVKRVTIQSYVDKGETIYEYEFPSLYGFPIALPVVLLPTGEGAIAYAIVKEYGTDGNADYFTQIEPVITEQPKNVTALSGEYVEFNVAATGRGMTYQWQFSSDSGAKWANIPTDAESDILIREAIMAINNFMFRCVITDIYGNQVTSDAATLTVLEG